MFAVFAFRVVLLTNTGPLLPLLIRLY